MRIHNGDREGFTRAAAMIADNPHAAHLLEYYACTGENADMPTLIAQSVRESEIGAYAIHGDAALICGVSRGDDRRMVWMTTTRNAGRYPVWLLREMRRILGDAEKYFAGRVNTFFQVIPVGYAEGMRFVRHLGFDDGPVLYQEKTGYHIHMVEKDITGRSDVWEWRIADGEPHLAEACRQERNAVSKMPRTHR